jgi:formyltetrahydrofolate hydrolase
MNGRLLITCPDRHGIVAAVAGFLASSGANIVTSDQHSTDPEGGAFFMADGVHAPARRHCLVDLLWRHRRFLAELRTPVINIHHSFLPAFAGADPYRRAAERGVKIIGATAHYVTEELDAGPIIEQDVARVSHREGPEAMMRIGRDIERTVLARAVKWHLEDRVLVHGNRTVVF